ncbi:MAG: glycine--tRNA ligase subunit beta [Erythrobacter sp.]|uniref:glycine--tRNA ligase subunit beta n=1 Tax=Erythrobacter sp. TaxID=1042 RepID=UPI0025DC379D|nr:glycine--tRNA ligase subunit beta [Erythrobacter sp.]MCL9999929.1 glycine--tRNA ligase subunit beta [Erythrobacter sp.]
MADFLLELRCEEIPARMQAGARAELEKLFRKQMDADGISSEDLTIWSTPRRLALIARGLPSETDATSVEVKGPRVGAPDQAINGFLGRYLANREELEERNGVYFLKRLAAGRPISRVLQEAVETLVREFSWPKSMRWGEASISTDSLRWVRPLSGIVALLDGDVLECDVPGIPVGRETYGHRFHSSGPIALHHANKAHYLSILAAEKVIVDHEKRAAIIREGAAKAAADAGLTLVADEGLVIENAGLTEWPVPLLGRFDEAFLDVPPEVIQLTARVNQKYFVCEDAQGQLANAFVCTANIDPLDPAVVVDGNRKVLAARLSDARFFWEQDQKTPLAEHAKKLARITFHEKLGTVADKVERVAIMARSLCEEEDILAGDPALAEQAARLAKADLVTEMVGEFPELQGLMGGYYAAKEGLPAEVAEAIRDHYKPVGQGDDAPKAPLAVAVSLADKLDTIACFFAIDEAPTGSKDPFALRRAALGVIRLILENDLRVSLKGMITCAWSYAVFVDIVNEIRRLQSGTTGPMLLSHVGHLKPHLGFAAKSDLVSYRQVDGKVDNWSFSAMPWHQIATSIATTIDPAPVVAFFLDRLKVQQREAGVRHDLIDAVFSLGGEDDLVRLLARVHALQAFVTTEDGTNLLAGYKRAANILKKEGYEGPAGTPDPQVLASLKEGNDTIPDTGEEDPLAMVDDPDVGDILAEEARDNSALSYTPEEAEKALIDALDAAAPRAAAAVEAEKFADAMAALATLRAPIDRFFEEVTVNDAQAEKRAARLALLARFRDAVHRVADFSRIEG